MAIATKTGEVVYLKKGDKGDTGPEGPQGEQGEKGDTGPAIRGPRRWEKIASGESLQSGQDGEEFIDIVTRGEDEDMLTYRCVVSHPKTSVWNSSQWVPASQFKFVATDLLMATYALIKNLGVSSVEITDADRGIVMRNAEGDIVFEARNGNVNITGNLKAGTVGAFTIDKGISNTEDNTNGYIEIVRSGGRFFRVNRYDSEAMVRVRSDTDGSTGIMADSYGGGTAIHAVSNNSGKGKAIDARGNVDLLARETERTKVNGLHLNSRKITGSCTLDKNDDIIWYGGATDITVHLSEFEDGKVLWLKRTGSGAVILAGQFIEPGTGDVVTNYYMSNGAVMAVKMPESDYWALFFCG